MSEAGYIPLQFQQLHSYQYWRTLYPKVQGDLIKKKLYFTHQDTPHMDVKGGLHTTPVSATAFLTTLENALP
jgi:hypothetical protein